jgi:hypothetical protein
MNSKLQHTAKILASVLMLGIGPMCIAQEIVISNSGTLIANDIANNPYANILNSYGLPQELANADLTFVGQNSSWGVVNDPNGPVNSAYAGVSTNAGTYSVAYTLCVDADGTIEISYCWITPYNSGAGMVNSGHNASSLPGYLPGLSTAPWPNVAVSYQNIVPQLIPSQPLGFNWIGNMTLPQYNYE